MQPTRAAPLATIALTLLAVAGLHGQETPDRWSSELGLSVNSSGGNERLTVVTTEVGLSHLETSRYELGMRGRVRYGRSEGVEVARSLHGTINADLWPGRPWSPFLFGTAEHDRFRRLDLRMNTGTGVKRTFWRDGWSETSLSGAVLYSYEELAVPDTLGTGISHNARWNWRARARREVRDGTRLQQLVFFQPLWDDFGDYQLEAQSTARIALSQALAISASFLYQRDSTPPPDVVPDDWSISIGLSIATTW